jgi:hypothetical protein
MTITAHCSELTSSFETHDIDNTRFKHAEHVQVAFELLGKYDFIDAAATYAKGVRSIAAKAGAPQKFNLTITYAFMSLIAERKDGSSPSAFPEFAKQNPDLMSKDVLAKWYSSDRLRSDAARSIFLMPEPTKPETVQGT